MDKFQQNNWITKKNVISQKILLIATKTSDKMPRKK